MPGMLSKPKFLVFDWRTIFCLLAAGAAFAQGSTGLIDVTVTDTPGSAVPEAAVRAINAGTGASFHAPSSDLGRCPFPIVRALTAGPVFRWPARSRGAGGA